ncbi:basic salivary proline-rich protein 4-like [Saccopteryx leptura]|uniref:basic salivary proline-rich protein 4-like n=1 Tax=Saccopteryx leptura TaxID=249018 RepID=UPI00339CC31E
MAQASGHQAQGDTPEQKLETQPGPRGPQLPGRNPLLAVAVLGSRPASDSAAPGPRGPLKLGRGPCSSSGPGVPSPGPSGLKAPRLPEALAAVPAPLSSHQHRGRLRPAREGAAGRRPSEELVLKTGSVKARACHYARPADRQSASPLARSGWSRALSRPRLGAPPTLWPSPPASALCKPWAEAAIPGPCPGAPGPAPGPAPGQPKAFLLGLELAFCQALLVSRPGRPPPRHQRSGAGPALVSAEQVLFGGSPFCLSTGVSWVQEPAFPAPPRSSPTRRLPACGLLAGSRWHTLAGFLREGGQAARAQPLVLGDPEVGRSTPGPGPGCISVICPHEPRSDPLSPQTPPGEDGEPPQTPPGEDGEPPQTPPGEDGEPPQIPPGEDGEPPQTPPGEDGEPPQTPPGEDGEPPQTPPGEDGEPPQTPPGEDGEPPQP